MLPENTRKGHQFLDQGAHFHQEASLGVVVSFTDGLEDSVDGFVSRKCAVEDAEFAF